MENNDDKFILMNMDDKRSKSIAEVTGADIAELQYKNEKKSKGFMKYFKGGSEVMMKLKPELLPLNKYPQDYELIFIGTPVWAGTYSSILNSFFYANRFKGKKIALFCCFGTGEGRTFENMIKMLRGNQILGEIGFKEPLKKDKEQNIQNAKDWAKTIINKK